MRTNTRLFAHELKPMGRTKSAQLGSVYAPLQQNQPSNADAHLQRASGNQRVQQVFKLGSDDCEREANRGTDRVMRQPVGAMQGSTHHTPSTQTEGARSNQPLSAKEKAFFEPLFGHDFSQVRIYADTRSAEMAEALNAEAFTMGHNIFFGAGKLRSQAGEPNHLLAHELTHVRQQARTGPALQAKLKITGTAANLARVVTLLNSGLIGYQVSIGSTGDVSVAANSIAGPPSSQQSALRSRLTSVINDPHDVIMTVSAGTRTLGGSYATADFDIADLETYGLPGLIHEIEEQYQKQVKGQAFGTDTTGAHSEAIKAESEVRGAKRGAQKVISSTANADGTLDAVVEIPHTLPDGKITTMVMTITRNNIVSVVWK